eukprot:COSAG04_NODE_15401_length_533_cov_0.711982_1_plen_27_part_01
MFAERRRVRRGKMAKARKAIAEVQQEE